MDGLDAFTRKAFEMVTSPAAQQAFDMHQEADTVARPLWPQRPGPEHAAGPAAGRGGRDLRHGRRGRLGHARQQLRGAEETKLPQFDSGLVGPDAGHVARGLLKNTLVMVWGEFGRTPRINKDAGRDHWPGAMSVVLAGGGLKMGQAIGASDAKAEYRQGTPADAGRRALDDVPRPRHRSESRVSTTKPSGR